MNPLSREVPIDPARAALLIIDVQNCSMAASLRLRLSGH
jgi:nicotinamidase-related amidase